MSRRDNIIRDSTNEKVIMSSELEYETPNVKFGDDVKMDANPAYQVTS